MLVSNLIAGFLVSVGLGQAPPPNEASLVLIHDDDMGNWFVLESVEYLLDGSALAKSDVAIPGRRDEPIAVWNGPVDPGGHELRVRLRYRGRQIGPVRYTDQYIVNVSRSFFFALSPGDTLSFRTIGNQSAIVDPWTDRPDIWFDARRAPLGVAVALARPERGAEEEPVQPPEGEEEVARAPEGELEPPPEDIEELAFFGFDKSMLTAAAKASVDRVAVVLERFPDLQLTIEGHADHYGPADYNLALSERRAHAVFGYLVDRKGIDPNRLAIEAYGETRPSVECRSTPACEPNRRVQFGIVEGRPIALNRPAMAPEKRKD